MPGNPFDDLLKQFLAPGANTEGGMSTFGPNYGMDPGQDPGQTGTQAYQESQQDPNAPEMLPWGVQAYPQAEPLTSTPNDSARMPQQQNPLQALFGMFGGQGGQGAAPTQRPGAAPVQPYQAPTTPGGLQPTSTPLNPEVDRGLFGNWSRQLYGPSNAEILQQQEFNMKEGLRARQNAATTQVLNEVQRIKNENPDMPRNMLQQQVFSSKAFLQNAMQNSPQEMAKFVNEVTQAIYGETKLHNTAPDASVLQFNPDTGAKPEVVFRAPKSFKAGEVVRATMMAGNDPKWKDLGITMAGKPDQMYEVEFAKDAEGKEYAKNFKAVGSQGVTVNYGDRLEEQEATNQIKIRNKIKDSQLNTLQLVRQVDRIIETSKKGGASNLGLYGTMLQGAQGLLEQGQAVARDAGLEFDPEKYAASFSGFKGLDKLAGNAAVVKSNILALAFSVAKANNNNMGNPSNAEVNNALKEIGAAFGSHKQLLQVLPELIGKAVFNADAFLDIEKSAFKSRTGKMEIAVPDSMSDILTRNGYGRYADAGKSGTGTGPVNEIPIGTRARGKDGRWRVFTGGSRGQASNWELEPGQ